LIEDKWRPKNRSNLSHENDLKFSKKVGIFPKMGFSKKVFTYAKLLMQRSLEELWGMHIAQCAPLIRR